MVNPTDTPTPTPTSTPTPIPTSVAMGATCTFRLFDSNNGVETVLGLHRNEMVSVEALPEEGLVAHEYAFDGEAYQQVTKKIALPYYEDVYSLGYIRIPSSFEVGSTHTLTTKATFDDASEKLTSYTFEVMPDELLMWWTTGDDKTKYYTNSQIPANRRLEDGGTYNLPNDAIIVIHANPHCLEIKTTKTSSVVNVDGSLQMYSSFEDFYSNKVYGTSESVPDGTARIEELQENGSTILSITANKGYLENELKAVFTVNIGQ